MNIIFVDVVQRTAITSMANVTAGRFVGITRVLAASYRLPDPISVRNRHGVIVEDAVMFQPVEGELTDAECHVQPEEFCKLVEMQMAMPRRLFYGWAETAAGMYERIKNCQYRWSWVETGEPYAFMPLFHGEGFRRPKRESNILIGIDPQRDRTR